MSDSLYPWQHAAWTGLQAMRGRLPHALLFHGPLGIGKTGFAERFAKSLLCQVPQPDGHPCDRCEACHWFSQYAHPDFRRVRPETLDEEESGAGEEGDDAPETKKSAKSAKAPSKEIKIDQVRALADFVNISTHRQGLRVILLYPADALNTMAANALLKTLEEPPPSTVFLLVSNQVDRLLPTILSRCRQFALGMPSRIEASAWLEQQGVKAPAHFLAEVGGAPLLALAHAQDGQRDGMDDFLRELAHPGIEGALKLADRYQKTPPIELVGWMQRWAYDVFSLKTTGEIRYYPRYSRELNGLAQRSDSASLMRLLKSLGDRKAIAEHPLSAKLFLEDMLLDYAAAFRS